MYEVMAALLPKYGRHPKRVSLPCREAQAEVEITSGGAVIDGGANGVLISKATAERKGLLDKVDKTTAVRSVKPTNQGSWKRMASYKAAFRTR